MVSCSFGCLSCVMTPCSLLFHVLSHPYILLHFEEMIFPLVPLICRLYSIGHSDLHGYCKGVDYDKIVDHCLTMMHSRNSMMSYGGRDSEKPA